MCIDPAFKSSFVAGVMDVLQQNSQPSIKLLRRVPRPTAPTAFQWRLQEQTGLISFIDELTRPSGHGHHNHGTVISFNYWGGGDKYLKSKKVQVIYTCKVSFFVIPIIMTMVRTCRTRCRGYIRVCESFSRCSSVRDAPQSAHPFNPAEYSCVSFASCAQDHWASNPASHVYSTRHSASFPLSLLHLPVA